MTKFKRYPCHNDQYHNLNQVLEYAIDSIKLAQLYDNKISVELAISHLLNWLDRKNDSQLS